LVPHAYWILAYLFCLLIAGRSAVHFHLYGTAAAVALHRPGIRSISGRHPGGSSEIAAEPFMEATVFFERDAYSIDTAARMTYKHR